MSSPRRTLTSHPKVLVIVDNAPEKKQCDNTGLKVRKPIADVATSLHRKTHFFIKVRDFANNAVLSVLEVLSL
jgi:hypothetical protein